MSRKFNHAFDIAFEVVTDKENPSDVTEQEILNALQERIDRLIESGQVIEAIDCYDSHEEE